MANHVYPTARDKFAEAQINWLADTVVCVLVNTARYTYSDAHASLADLPSSARIATSGTLTSRTTTLGVFDADDVTFTAVSGTVVGAVILYKATGTALTSPLISYYDQAIGLPVNPAGGNITVVWDNGTNKVLAL